MKQYGLPYKGSKHKIAMWVVNNLPRNEHFYDLFGGGCAVTHAAILSRRYEHYHVNDITPVPMLFSTIANGEMKNDVNMFVSRDEFNKNKSTDMYIAITWSYGNNMDDYLYSEEKEPIKLACHNAVVFDLWDDLHKHLDKDVCEACRNALCGVKSISIRRITFQRIIKRISEKNSAYERLQHLERVERINTIIGITKNVDLVCTTADYRNVDILPNSTVYCDIPYINTRKYNKEDFDHDSFYEWCLTRDYPVFVSEYYMPNDFAEIDRITRLGSQSHGHPNMTIEKIYVQRKYADKYNANLFNFQ